MHHATENPEGGSESHETSKHGKDDEDREESERQKRKGNKKKNNLDVCFGFFL